MKRLSFAVAFCLALVAMPASAQFAVYGGGGAAFPTGDDMDAAGVEGGLQLFGGATFDINEKFSVYAEGQWGTHNLENSETKAKPAALMGGVLFSFLDEEAGPVSPYVFAGGGLQSLTLDPETGDSVDDSAFGWHLGGGVGFDVAGLGAFAEGRYQAANFSEGDLGDFDFAIFSLAVGLSFELGGS